MTDNATGDRAGNAGGAGTQRDSDDPITFSPLTVPDRERRRRRNRVIGIAAAVVVIAGGITTWVVVAGGGDDKPVKHTAVLPKAFGEYTQVTKPEDSLWKSIGGDNPDPLKKGGARVTYTAPDGTGATVSVEVNPPDFTSDDGTRYAPGSDTFTKSLLGVEDLKGVREYPAGKSGGTIQCADPSSHGVTITTCGWQSTSATVTYTPVRDGKTVTDKTSATADNLKTFLDALKIEPLKS
ncbi:hypothetical protein [Streptomyces sp. NPDC021020]|uniref:hypothetical protein n=1 Tax=Streptomyces sp. NPDC021020 TaxID=3365109 RepID=UPI0037A18FCE